MMECTRLAMTMEVSCRVYPRPLVPVVTAAVIMEVIHLPVPEAVQAGTIIPETMAMLVQEADMEASATLERHTRPMATQAAPTTKATTTADIIHCIQAAVVDHDIDPDPDLDADILAARGVTELSAPSSAILNHGILSACME